MVDLETHLQDTLGVIECEDLSGFSLNDFGGSGRHAAAVEGWLIPPNPPAPDTSAEDLAWTTPRRHQPARCFSQKLRLTHAAPSFARSYIHCTRKAGSDVF